MTAWRVLRLPAEVLGELFSSWFPFGRHLIEGLYRTARTIEATARQRESLITLGTIAAGLAHELNNPAAAATRAIDALDDALRTLLSAAGRLAHGDLSPAQFATLSSLREEIAQPSPGNHDPVALADREDSLSSWLTDHGVDRDWVIAPALAAADVDAAWCDRAAEVLEGQALQAGLEWVASTLSAAELLAEIKTSSRRISDLVGAMRSYSQMDRAAVQRIDVTEGLESTLVMPGHKLRDAVTVVRDYSEDVPQIDAYPGELNQVWTNLINNAIDAMAGTGTLRLATRVDADQVVVEVCDNGSGMSPAVAPSVRGLLHD